MNFTAYVMEWDVDRVIRPVWFAKNEVFWRFCSLYRSFSGLGGILECDCSKVRIGLKFG